MIVKINVPLVQRTLPAPITILRTVGRTQGAYLLRMYRFRGVVSVSELVDHSSGYALIQ